MTQNQSKKKLYVESNFMLIRNNIEKNNLRFTSPLLGKKPLSRGELPDLLFLYRYVNFKVQILPSKVCWNWKCAIQIFFLRSFTLKGKFHTSTYNNTKGWCTLIHYMYSFWSRIHVHVCIYMYLHALSNLLVILFLYVSLLL